MWRLDIWNAFKLKYNSTTHAVNSSHQNPRRKLHIFQQFLTNLSHKRHCDICQLQIICPPILAHITMLTFSRNIVSTHAMLHSMLLSSHNCHGIISIQITMIAADFSNVRKMRFVAGDNLFRDDSINQNWHFPCLEPFSLQQNLCNHRSSWIFDIFRFCTFMEDVIEHRPQDSTGASRMSVLYF